MIDCPTTPRQLASSRSIVSSQAGIAIGPILFVVAILAILATAIAAGSGTFASNASQETNRTYASSVMAIGQQLKLGTDRLLGLGMPLANVDINAQNTSGNLALFSPTGGGLIPPSTALAASPATDSWIYTWGAVTNLGSGSPERIAALRVNQGVCDQINGMAANGAAPTPADLGAIDNTTNFSVWPAALAGKMTGCVNNTNATANGSYFYQVLGVQ